MNGAPGWAVSMHFEFDTHSLPPRGRRGRGWNYHLLTPGMQFSMDLKAPIRNAMSDLVHALLPMEG
jgi:hypothetical protein